MVCILPSKEELLASIHSDMQLTKDLLKRIYGYGVTDASFPDKAVAAIEAAGCSKAEHYYKEWVRDYETAYREEIRPVAAWFQKECARERAKKQEEGEEKRKQQWMELSEILGYQLTKMGK